MSRITRQQAVTKAVWLKEMVGGEEAQTQNQNTDDALIVEFIEALVSIDTSSPLAKLNETSIIGNDSKRILL